MEFFIDAVRASQVVGWAWLPDDPETLLTIELVANDGAVVAETVAEGFRGDLATAGKRGGWCGFVLPIPPGCPSGDYGVRVRDGLAVTELAPPFHHDVAGEAARAGPSFDGTLSDDQGARGHLDRAGPCAFAGWVHCGRPFGPLRSLDLVADGHVVASGPVDGWRNDIEDLLQGDGRVGFDIALPADLYDGREHDFDLRWSDAERSLLGAPVTLRTDPTPPPTATAPPIPARPAPDAPIELSVLVNFHDMHREAERTLTSLSRSFQRDIGDLAYEVLCIDNGSVPAMTDAEIARHGPEFRLFRPSASHPSPVFALNEAAAAARGRHLAVMIDGAHLLSPGVLSEAIAALRAEPRAMVAVRHWFIGGDQRWLSTVGYSRGHEDLPFAKIGWPDCGYDLFKISAPIFDSPNTWFDSMSESNCLFLSAADFAELGGYDRGFTSPGAGFANLDLFARASRLPGMAVIALIGEASFHQYHGGTTTNVTDAEKESRVRRYASSFEALRGHSYQPVSTRQMKFRGAIHSDFAMNARQRPSGKVRLGLTPRIRPIPISRAFEEGARTFARTAYVESGGHLRSLWAGQPTGVAPADLIEIQQMLWNERPDVLVLKDVAPGLLAFVRSIMPAVRLEGMTLVWITAHADGETPPGVRRIVGELADERVRRHTLDEIGTAEGVSVLFQPREDEPVPVDPLRRYGDLVSAGGYLVVLGAAFGQPGLGYATRWTANAIHRYLKDGAPFVVDRTFDAHLVTTCPSGFLRRRPDLRAGQPYDERLDSLLEFETA